MFKKKKKGKENSGKFMKLIHEGTHGFYLDMMMVLLMSPKCAGFAYNTSKKGSPTSASLFRVSILLLDKVGVVQWNCSTCHCCLIFEYFIDLETVSFQEQIRKAKKGSFSRVIILPW